MGSSRAVRVDSHYPRNVASLLDIWLVRINPRLGSRNNYSAFPQAVAHEQTQNLPHTSNLADHRSLRYEAAHCW
jgi:hypothetical protein